MCFQLRNILLPVAPKGSTPTQLTHVQVQVARSAQGQHTETINHWCSHTMQWPNSITCSTFGLWEGAGVPGGTRTDTGSGIKLTTFLLQTVQTTALLCCAVLYLKPVNSFWINDGRKCKRKRETAAHP